MKLRVSTLRRYMSIPEQDNDEVFAVIDFANRDLELTFVEDDKEFTVDERGPFYRRPDFRMSPTDLRSAIVAYLNSVPSQEDIAAAMCEAQENGEVTCINPGKGIFKRTEKIEIDIPLNGTTVLDLIQKRLLCFYKTPSDYLGSKGFVIQMSKKVMDLLEYQLSENPTKEVMFCKSSDGALLIRYNYTFSRAGKSVPYSDAFLEISVNNSLDGWITIEERDNE